MRRLGLLVVSVVMAQSDNGVSVEPVRSEKA
jgi:hypothetical protein